VGEGGGGGLNYATRERIVISHQVILSCSGKAVQSRVNSNWQHYQESLEHCCTIGREELYVGPPPECWLPAVAGGGSCREENSLPATCSLASSPLYSCLQPQNAIMWTIRIR